MSTDASTSPQLPDDPAILQRMIHELLEALRGTRRENEQLQHRLDQLLRRGSPSCISHCVTAGCRENEQACTAHRSAESHRLSTIPRHWLVVGLSDQFQQLAFSARSAPAGVDQHR